MRRLIIGCGYLGRRVAGVWRDQGDQIWALTRSTEHAATLTEMGISPLVGDVLDRETLSSLPAVDTVLYAVGYDRTAAATKRAVYVEGLRNVLSSLPASCGRLIYVSSTSVYGQSQGEWVDETSACEPASEGGEICLAAEQLARTEYPGADGVSVLRMSGLYGPGRLAARVAALRQQQPIAASPDGWLNLIHVEDACGAVILCADLANPVETLVVSDDQPLLRRDYYRQLTAAIAAPPPVFDSSTGTDRGKRCSNQRLRQSLGMELQYPTLAEGLPTATS